MNNLTIEQVIERLNKMEKRLEEMKSKYPHAKWSGIKLKLDGEKFEDAKRVRDGVGYWSLNGGEIWIDLTLEKGEEEDF